MVSITQVPEGEAQFIRKLPVSCFTLEVFAGRTDRVATPCHTTA